MRISISGVPAAGRASIAGNTGFLTLRCVFKLVDDGPQSFKSLTLAHYGTQTW